jgi:hypothetical protein
MKTKSRSTESDLVLGTLKVSEIKEFLLDCVNLPDCLDRPSNAPALERWLHRWQRLFTFQQEQIRDVDGESPAQNWIAREIPRCQLEDFAPTVRVMLHRIWLEQDPRQREWYTYKLRDAYHHMVVRAENPHLVTVADGLGASRLRKLERVSRARGGNPKQKARFFQTQMGADLFEYVPTICPFEAAIYWLQHNQHLMLRCAADMCAAPYFFRSKKGQKYCSPECGDPARKDSKRRWWAENRGKNSKG